MFCNNCGNQIPDGSKFCASCGAPAQAAAPQTEVQQPEPQQAQPVYTAPQQTEPVYAAPQQPQKKKAPIWLAAVIGLAAFAIAALIIAPAISGGSNNGGSSETNGAGQLSNNVQTNGIDTPDATGSSEQDIQLPSNNNAGQYNPKYTEIFTSNNIIETPVTFSTPKSVFFADESYDGTVIRYAFGYKDDMVCEMSITYYGTTEDILEYYESTKQDTLSLDFVTVSYEKGTQYDTVTVFAKELDQPENALATVGEDTTYLSEDGTYISVTKFAKELEYNFEMR